MDFHSFSDTIHVQNVYKNEVPQYLFNFVKLTFLGVKYDKILQHASNIN